MAADVRGIVSVKQIEGKKNKKKKNKNQLLSSFVYAYSSNNVAPEY